MIVEELLKHLESVDRKKQIVAISSTGGFDVQTVSDMTAAPVVILHLIGQGEQSPKEITVIEMNNVPPEEMEDRIKALLKARKRGRS